MKLGGRWNSVSMLDFLLSDDEGISQTLNKA